MTADGAATVEALRAELARAKEQARLGNAAALKAAEELKAEKAAHGESRDKMAKMAIELKAAADRCRVLEKENQAKASDLEKAAATRKDIRSAMRAKKEELREAGDIVAGKSFMLRRKFGDPRYAPLDRLWSSEDVYMDLAASAADAAKYFQGQTDREVDQLFWRSACIEGARMAFARVKAYWAEMDATNVAARDSAIGRKAAEHYFEEVLEGARLIETQCSKNIMFE